MLFAHDTEISLAEAAELVNTLDVVTGEDDLDTVDALDAFLADHPYSGSRARGIAELETVQRLRTRLRELWTEPDRDRLAGLLNAMLRDADARPYLARHDAWDWHLHATEPDAPLAHRIAAEVAMAVSELLRADELDRLRTCAAEDCQDVLVDLSRNRSKRYCDITCGNRANVHAYRARQRAR